MTPVQKQIIITAIEAKISATSRAQAKNKSPNFAPVFDKELTDLRECLTMMIALDTTVKK